LPIGEVRKILKRGTSTEKGTNGGVGPAAPVQPGYTVFWVKPEGLYRREGGNVTIGVREKKRRERHTG